jgi:toxin ParE1/3/4
VAEYRLSPRAERDMIEIWRYTNKQWGREQANRYILALKAKCAELAKAPLLAESYAHVRPGYRRLSIENHTIYFRQTSYGIAIIRILHQRMDVGRHL